MNTETIAFPKDFLECLQCWQGIRSDLQVLDADTVAYVEGKMASASWAWAPVVEGVDPSKMDRLGESLRSPAFSSAAHPWPEAEGKPMLPVLQLNLAQASRLGGIALGDGLLQMFVGANDRRGENPHFRVVPAHDVDIHALTPVPEFGEAECWIVSLDWARMAFDEDEPDTQGLQIVSYESPRFVLQRMDLLSEIMDLNDLGDAVLVKRIKAFDVLLKKRAPMWRPNGSHLFGTFESIQYAAADKPKPLFCLESETFGFNFGDGNGQLFFDGSDPRGPRVSFDWSCC